MLFTPGEPLPAETPPGFQTHETSAGTFLYNPERLSPAGAIEVLWGSSLLSPLRGWGDGF